MNMRIIDFRARPNTEEYMVLYPTTPKDWEESIFFCPKPKPEPLSNFIKALDRVGVSLAVFTGRQSPAKSLSNDYVAECVGKYPDRLIGFAGIDPTKRLEAVREIDRAVTRLGMKGVALDPSMSRIYPDDRLLYPIYYKCLELDIPVVLTMGPLVGKWADPVAVDRVAEDLPDLKMLCAHGIYPRVGELIALAYRRKNVFLEASIYEHFLPGTEAVIEAAKTVLQDKVIYGSGFPFRPLEDLEKFKAFNFEPEVLEKLLYHNAARLLNIT
jgi:predicted TIM-barrel fold metal-dependent hydrolase